VVRQTSVRGDGEERTARDRRRIGPEDPCFPRGDAVFAKPCPTELIAPLNPDRGLEGQRNLFCHHYDACLDEAVKKGWNSFTCLRCPLHGLEREVGRGIESYATQRRFA
jgi:hypothetical protein